VSKCPKCGAPVPDDAIECPRCGIVFAKFAHRPAEPDQGAAPSIVEEPLVEKPSGIARDRLRGATRLARAAVVVGLIVWTWQFAREPMGEAVAASILHGPNLVFHEAGHVLFGFFGRFIAVLGGSLFQFALPLALAGVFLKQHNPFGAVVCTWWAGQNLLDVAPYIADARALQLVLLGGKTGGEVEGHDWEYLLTEMGWLHHDGALGLWAHRLGLMMMVGAVIWGAIYVAQNREEPPEPLVD
jgi:hypothetical protein